MKCDTKLILALMVAALQVDASPLAFTSSCKGDISFLKGEIKVETPDANPVDSSNNGQHHQAPSSITARSISEDKDQGDKFRFNKIECDEGKGILPDDVADMDPLYTGVDYLRGLEGNFTLKHNGCARVSCSWRAGIHICWDKYPETFTAPWDHVADGVEVLLDKCAESIYDMHIKGEAEDGNGVRIKVQRSNC